jgi:hypothetical protein
VDEFVFDGAMVPSTELPPGIPLTSQVTVALGGTQREAVKTWVAPVVRLTFAGERKPDEAQVIVTLADADFEESATLAAVTVTVVGDGGTGGAVYVAESAPVGVMTPKVELPPEMPLTLQVTAMLGLPVPVTVAVKACVPPVGVLADVGNMLTAMSL